MKVSIDEQKCSGHGRCYTLSPALFDCDDEGFPVVLVESFDDAADSHLGATVAWLIPHH